MIRPVAAGALAAGYDRSLTVAGAAQVLHLFPVYPGRCSRPGTLSTDSRIHRWRAGTRKPEPILPAKRDARQRPAGPGLTPLGRRDPRFPSIVAPLKQVANHIQ